MKYEKQVSLLIDLIPSVAADSSFALKGGTAINLFYLDMPRLSVDLDLVYLPSEPREDTLKAIDQKLKELKDQIQRRFPSIAIETRPSSPDLGRQILCRYQGTQVKIEVNIIIRGTLYPVTQKALAQGVQDAFKKDARMQVVALEDLYGSKICAALDRQHPRDLYDMMLFLEQSKITPEAFNAFIFYLISHNRPIAEVLSPNLLDIEDIYTKDFVGMTKEHVPLERLVETRTRLISEIHSAFTKKHKDFLLSFKAGEPDWQLFALPQIESLPSVQWKLQNIRAMSKSKREIAYKKLESLLEFIEGKFDDKTALMR